MKLLRKSVLQNDIAIQKKQRIDEGVRIAQKVDILRQTLASLESQHALFLQKTKDELKRTTEGLNDGILAKRKELEEIEEERRKLLIPLDREWKEIEKKSKDIDILREITEKHLLIASKIEIKTEQKYKESRDLLAKSKLIKTASEEAYNHVSNLKNTIENILVENENREVSIEEYLLEKNAELLTREASIATKERENKIESDQLDKEKEEIIKEKAQLADQRATLERALKRIK